MASISSIESKMTLHHDLSLLVPLEAMAVAVAFVLVAVVGVFGGVKGKDIDREIQRDRLRPYWPVNLVFTLSLTRSKAFFS
jgi:hypothetical protein